MSQKIGSPGREEKAQLRHGSMLTPLALTRAVYNADQGFMQAICDVFDEVREIDSHLQGILQKRELRVASADIEIAPSRKRRTTKKARNISDFCEEALLGIEDFRPLVAHLMSGIYMGRAVAEIEWSKSNGYIVPTKWYFIHSRRVSFNDTFEPIFYDEGGGQYRWPGTKLSSFTPGKLLYFAPSVRHSYPTREGVGRNVVWPASFKRWGIRDWLALAELAGRPAKIGYFGTGKRSQNDTQFGGVSKLPEATKEHQQTLLRAVRAYSTSLEVILPDTTILENVFPPGNLDSVHTNLIEWCNAEMSKAVTGETLTTDAGTRGARSLGDVHVGEATMVARWDALQLASAIRTQILAPMVRMNFGADAPVPFIHFNVDPEGSLDAEATRIQKLTSSGVRLSSGEVRSKFGYSEPDPDEETFGGTVSVIKPAEPPPAPPQPIGDAQLPSGGDGEPVQQQTQG